MNIFLFTLIVTASVGRIKLHQGTAKWLIRLLQAIISMVQAEIQLLVGLVLLQAVREGSPDLSLRPVDGRILVHDINLFLSHLLPCSNFHFLLID